MAINIVKLENGNVALYDNGTGDFLRSLSADYVELECNVNGNVKLIQDNGNVEFFTPALVANTQVLPAAAVPFAGTCADLAELLATDFFFEVTGGGGVDFVYPSGTPNSFTFLEGVSTIAAQPLAADILQAFPILIRQDIIINSFAINTTTTAAGNSVWGLYDSANGLPNSLVFETSPFSHAVAGIKSFALANQVIKKGLYYVAYNSADSISVSSIAAETVFNIIGALNFSTTPYTAVRRNAVVYSGNLPTTFGAISVSFYVRVPMCLFNIP